MSGITIALAQINPTVGDIDGNVKRILDAYGQACAKGAALVVFPELCITGYPPEDLVLMPVFRESAMKAAHSLAPKTQGSAAMIVGCVWEAEGNVYNAALLLDEGKIAHVQRKSCLPNYSVFDEERLFVAGAPQAVDWRGQRLGIMVCEDTWHEAPARALAKQGARLLISINASPFEAGKVEQRIRIARQRVADTGLPLLYVNSVGGQDDIVFDGGSFVMDKVGEIALQLKQFEVDSGWWMVNGNTHPANHQPLSTHYQLWQAMKLGLADYVCKNGFKGVLVGLSGGIDSALTAAVAVDALGKDAVRGVLLPSPYTSKDSVEDAQALAKHLGIHTDIVPITPGMQTLEEVLSPAFHDSGWMEEVSIGGNLQARLRGLILMAFSNKTGYMLLSTGNKSEIAVGYTTLYGDSCGGYNVLKDVYKTQIYALAHWRNAQGRVIPERSISKAPSAELAPGQKDSDQLPPYDVLDAILMLHIEGRLSADDIIGKGFDKAVVKNVVRMVRVNEYKRRQSCPGVKLSPMLFGKDRRYPITNKF